MYEEEARPMCDWIIYLFRRLPTDAGELEQLANRLGVSLFATLEGGRGPTVMNTYEVQRRIREWLRHRLDSWLWLVAFLSAAASVFSAAAAWWVVLHSKR
jgi:hypothetical protein